MQKRTIARMDNVRRIFRPERLLRGDTGVNPLQPLDDASWIWAPDAPEPPPREGVFLRFRLEFERKRGESAPRIDVTADERFVLFLDGAPVASGPHRGTPERWTYQSFELASGPGRHRLEAVVWRLGNAAPSEQLSVRGGFALAASGPWHERLSTGRAPWSVARLSGTRPGGSDPESVSACVGTPFEVRGTSAFDEEPPPGSWTEAVAVRGPVWPHSGRNLWGGRSVGWQLYPSVLPDMLDRRLVPGRFRTGPLAGSRPGPFAVPARSRVEVVWDLGEYFCARPELVVDGGAGATVRWGWAEGLRGADGLKLRNRNEWKGASFSGFTDVFLPDGRKGARFTTPWWRSGRWCRIEIETAGEPLRAVSAAILETRYPLEPEDRFECDDPTLADVRRICVRGLQMCMHETFFDCPHYEQQQYVGDTRLQMLVAAAISPDDRLVRHAADLFDLSRREDGIPAMQFPSRKRQESGTYALVWPLILRDAMMLRDCREWLRAKAPGMRQCLHGLALYENGAGLLEGTPGWSFVDWSPAWNDRKGVPPGGNAGEGGSAPANLFRVLALQAAAEIESALGENRLAAYWRAEARRATAAVLRAFWCESRGLLADDPARTSFSEHAQSLAIVAGILSPARRRRAFEGLLGAPDLARATVYFSHYLFEAFLRLGRADLFLRRLDLWRDFAARGLRTPLEAPDCGKNGQKEPRSDCHAWGSHPLWHLHAGVAGVRPDAPFYGAVRVAPCPGPLRRVRSATPTPRGPVALDLAFDGAGGVRGSVALPPGLSGVFAWNGRETRLDPGSNRISRIGRAEAR